jgi:putative redox protein
MTIPTEGTLVASVHARCEARYSVDTTIRGHRLPADEPASRGGSDSGPTPVEGVAAALAACTAITLRMYAERKGWELQTVKVDCRAFAADTGYRFERSIQITAPLDAVQLSRLAAVAERTPVTKIVRAGAPIATDLR